MFQSPVPQPPLHRQSPVIWLAYVSYPITTAVYFERALRQSHRVVTCGPSLPPSVIESWNLQSLHLPIVDHNLTLDWTPDMEVVLQQTEGRLPSPDLYLWIESIPGYHPKNLRALKCPKVCYLIDSHLNLREHLAWALQFDRVFIAQREYLDAFRAAGVRNVHWLPLACDPEVHSKRSDRKRYDVGFVGSVAPGTRRQHLLQHLAGSQFLVEPRRLFWDRMAHHISESRIGFNNAIVRDLNMRFFETLSTGTFLLTDMAENSGQDELFRANEDYGLYRDPDLIDSVRTWLIQEEEREAIAQRSRRLVHQSHTYAHRCADLVAVSLGGQRDTLSAGQLRERSVGGLATVDAWVTPPAPRTTGRSFIIPVLDADLDEPEGFHRLLADLEGVEGEVVAVFNSPGAADAYRGHPRINLSASLNVNVGVSRAWNLGTHLATQPTLFFFNADLRIEPATIDLLEQALWHLPDAGAVGPQGSFVRFSTYSDVRYFDKGQARTPVAVDAVSGFLFAVKRELFAAGKVRFEDAYTPCFSEEWDFGLQLKRAGYKSYVVPVTGYQHQWGISSNLRKTVRYYDQEEPACEILARNRIHFWRKWLRIAAEDESVGAESSSSNPGTGVEPVAGRV